MVPIFRRFIRVPALLAGFLLLAVAGMVLTDPVVPERAELAASPARNTLTRITDFSAGTYEGARTRRGVLTVRHRAAGHLRYGGKRWAWSRWTSGWINPGHGFEDLIPSWDAVTPRKTFVRVLARARTTSGATSRWKRMANWATWDAGFRRASAGTQADSVARVSTDTLVASGADLTGYQLRVTLAKRPRTSAKPRLRTVQAVASRPASSLPSTSARALPAKTLRVPAYSQMIHRGEYPQYGGGGEAWCSPTSLSMILGYYGAKPGPGLYGWVNNRYADPWVDHVARAVYDYRYQGTGNWAFNTGYAANRTDDAFVTRLADLREAERFIAAGIPLAASISFGRGQLSGAPISSTPGHLVVIVGFTRSGDVVVNDPAAWSNGSVRRTYDRGQFERAWLRKSAGTVYVVHDAAHPLPSRSGSTAW